MSFEESLEKLKQRHEALTQSVELLVAENRRVSEENRQMAEENKKRDRRLAELMDAVTRLVHVAEIHEQRIERLEDDNG
jgi:hypothetical protein